MVTAWRSLIDDGALASCHSASAVHVPKSFLCRGPSTYTSLQKPSNFKASQSAVWTASQALLSAPCHSRPSNQHLLLPKMPCKCCVVLVCCVVAYAAVLCCCPLLLAFAAVLCMYTLRLPCVCRPACSTCLPASGLMNASQCIQHLDLCLMLDCLACTAVVCGCSLGLDRGQLHSHAFPVVQPADCEPAGMMCRLSLTTCCQLFVGCALSDTDL